MRGEWSQRDQTLKRTYELNHAGSVNDADLYTEEKTMRLTSFIAISFESTGWVIARERSFRCLSEIR